MFSPLPNSPILKLRSPGISQPIQRQNDFVRALESVRLKPNAVCFLSRDKCLVELADFYGEGDRATATGGDASGNQIMMGSELWTAESAAASESNRPSLVSCDLCMQVAQTLTEATPFCFLLLKF